MSLPLRTFFRLLSGGRFRLLRNRLNHRLRVRCLKAGQAFFYRRAGIRYFVDPRQTASVASYLEEMEDGRELRLWQKWLQPGDHVIDGGAHTGAYAFAAAARLSSGKIVAVEADPDLADFLKMAGHRLGFSPVLEVAACALSDHNGTANFYFSPPSGNGRVLQSLHAPRPDFEARPVAIETLADLASRHFDGAAPAAVKLDLEGAENLALSAAPPAWFSPQGPLWTVEINRDALARFQTTPEAILRHFPATSFDVFLLPHYPHAPMPDTLRPSGFSSWNQAAYFNLVAVPTGPLFTKRRQRLRHLLP